MLQIAITQPFAVNKEDVIIRHLLANGFDVVHLRKPDADIEYCRDLLGRLSPAEHSRIVVHDYPVLYDEYTLRGIHLNHNYTSYPPHYQGTRTRSCHTFEEVARYKDECDYLFLSPIFDSISKVGYRSRFSHAELSRASAEGIIDERVVALGGVTFDKIAYLKELNFGGIAMLGGLYNLESL